MKTRIIAFVVFFMLALGGSTSHCANLTWTGSISTDWNDPNNWTPQQIPAASDHVIINSGNLTIPADGVFAIMDWTGGGIYGVLTVASNGVLNINGGGGNYLYGSLTNGGTVNWLAGDIYGNTCYGVSGPLVNLAGGLWNIQCDQTLSCNTTCGSGAVNAYFQNAGTVRKTAGTNTTSISIAFDNNAAVEADQGIIGLENGGTLGGMFVAMAGAAIDFDNGIFPLVSGPPVSSGAGQVQFTSGASINFTGPITNFTMTAGQVIGNNTVSGTFNWMGGAIFGALNVLSNGVLNINGGGGNYLYGSLTNGGTVNWLAGDIYGNTCYGVSGPLVNLAGGLWNIQCDQTLSCNTTCGSGAVNAYFQNAGTVRKTAGTNTTSISIAFDNNAAVEADQGTIGLENGGTLGGMFVAMAGAAIDFDNGIFPLVSGPPVSSGAGQVQFTSGASINFTGPITNFTLTAGQVIGNNTVSGTFNWMGGAIFGALNVLSNGVLNINGGGNYLYGSLTNGGTVNWLAGDIYGNTCIGVSGPLVNLTGGVWNIQCDQTLSCYTGCGSGAVNAYFQNAGTVRKTAGTNTTSFSIAFDNSATVEADQGTIGLENGGTLGGMFVAAAGAAIDFDSGTFPLVSGPPVSSGAGQVQFTSGASINFTGPITNFTMTAGQLIGNNTVSGTFNWIGGGIFGTLNVLSNGVLNINGGGGNYLYGSLTNGGTVNWLAGDIYGNTCIGVSGPLVNLAGGVWNIQCDQTLSCYTGCGSGAVNAYFQNAGTLRKTAGTNTTSISIAFDNNATVAADIGTISLQSSYSETSSASLAVSLGGVAPGSGYGKIIFSTPLSLDGTFTVMTRNGYLPNPGDTFQFLNYPSSTNSFTCLSGLDLGGGILLQPRFTSTGLTLVATSYTTNASQPQLFINRTLGGMAITWPVGFPGWTLQSTTDLAVPDWTPVSNACENQAVVPISAPQQYFRLKAP